MNARVKAVKARDNYKPDTLYLDSIQNSGDTILNY